MLRKVTNFLRIESGQATAEYAFILTLVSIAVLLAVKEFGQAVADLFPTTIFP